MANKIGDILLLFACLFFIVLYNSLYFNVIFLCVDYYLNYINEIHNMLISSNFKGYFLSYNNEITYIFLDNNYININSYLNMNLYSFIST